MRINKSFDVVYLAYSCLGLSFDFENRSEDQTFEIAPRCRPTIDDFYFYHTNCISLKGMSSLNKGRCHLIFCVSAATHGRRRRRTDSAVDACTTVTSKVFTRANFSTIWCYNWLSPMFNILAILFRVSLQFEKKNNFKTHPILLQNMK